MKMSDYLTDIEYAATKTIDLIWSEHSVFENITAKAAALVPAVKAGYASAEFMAMNAETPDDVMEAAGTHWDTYFGADKERFETEEKRVALEALISVRSFSTSAQAATILQYAKQGISIVHRTVLAAHKKNETHIALGKCPPGRMVGSQALRDVVWQGRNHALHWEEGKPSSSVEQCFKTLATDFGPAFTAYLSQNLSFEVIDVLKWKTFGEFQNDMLSLA